MTVVSKVLLGCKDLVAKRDKTVQMASPVLLDLEDRRAIKGLLEQEALQAILVHVDQRVTKETQGHRDCPDLQEIVVLKDSRETLALLAKQVNEAQLDRKETLVPSVQQVVWDLRGLKETKAIPALLVALVHSGPKEPREILVRRETRVLLVPLVLLGNAV